MAKGARAKFDPSWGRTTCLLDLPTVSFEARCPQKAGGRIKKGRDRPGYAKILLVSWCIKKVAKPPLQHCFAMAMLS